MSFMKFCKSVIFAVMAFVSLSVVSCTQESDITAHFAGDSLASVSLNADNGKSVIAASSADDSYIIRYYYGEDYCDAPADRDADEYILDWEFVYDFAPAGMEFSHWNTSPDGCGKRYNSLQQVCNIADAGQVFSLYAIWDSQN